MMPREYDVPVGGGTLHVGEWGPADGPAVVLVHGITASHRQWNVVARALPEVRFIAPDLRGRGRSNGLGAPYGMAAHAADLEAMMGALGVARAPIVGHSMGGFVALVASQLYPERFQGLLLVDGGLPLELPEGADVDAVVAASLGPAADRLSMTFASPDEYLGFWRRHPALGPNWSDDVEQYALYDLQGEAPELRASTAFEAMAADSHELYESAAVSNALDSVREFTLLTAPRGLLDQTPGLYPPDAVERWRRALPLGTFIEVPDVNHYTIAMAERGAQTIAAHIRPLVGA
ncbi:MAG: alpha/beta hydrolase [Microbacteriaceae bacterium]|nr:alpha/beta hydrolase [Microbacteriaceae bacterium]